MTERKRKAIGVFDSGVGGLTVAGELMNRLAGEDIVYLADSARVPYGTKSPDTVLRFTRESLDFLKGRNVKLIVIACNTASSVALPKLVCEEDIPLVGVLLPGARAAAKASRNGKIAVIGTPATIRSRAYETALREIDQYLDVRSHPCPLFVSLAEEGWLEDDVARMVAHRYLDPLAGFGADTMVLGCTHYPLLKGVISEAMGSGVTLVDSAKEAAAEVESVLEREGLARGRREGGKFECYVTDNPYLFREVGERFLGWPINKVEHVSF